MFEEAINRPSRWRVFWPEVSDLAGAREAMQLGSWLAFLAAIVSLGGAILAGFAGAPLLDAAFFGVVGVGIRRHWRVAAVIGLVVQGLGLVYAVSQGGLPGIVSVLCLVGMVNAVRGTFAFARLNAAHPFDSSLGGAGLANKPLQPTSGGISQGEL